MRRTKKLWQNSTQKTLRHNILQKVKFLAEFWPLWHRTSSCVNIWVDAHEMCKRAELVLQHGAECPFCHSQIDSVKICPTVQGLYIYQYAVYVFVVFGTLTQQLIHFAICQGGICIKRWQLSILVYFNYNNMLQKLSRHGWSIRRANMVSTSLIRELTEKNTPKICE